MSELNGAKPSRNGTNPAGAEVTLMVNDRLDALERLLGTVRRRGMTLRIHSLARKDDHLVLVFRADSNAPVPERWIAELGALVDVRNVQVAGQPAATR
jgi:acetolactate synthase regulatory subunit